MTASARRLGHYLAFGITLGMLVGVWFFVLWSTKKRVYQSKWKKYGPTIVVGVAIPFIMLDLTRHVLQDTNVWPEDKGSAQYVANCGHENARCLSTLGWICYISTYVGFAILVVGTMWNAHFIDQLSKIRMQWRVLRGRDPYTNEPRVIRRVV